MAQEQVRQERGKMQKINGVLGPAMVGVDTIMRVKDGEAVPVALGKAMLTNAAWSLIPGGVVAGVGVMAGMAAFQMAPVIGQAVNAKSAKMGQKELGFGGASKFIGSEAQQNMMSQGLSQMNQASNHGVRAMANHARNAHKTY